MIDLSIIIVNWNTREDLQACLKSVEETKGSLSLDTIVVDNHSVDGSGEMVSRSFPNVRLVNSGGNLGFGRGCNLGLALAQAPLVLFLNPDTEIRGDALAKMVAFMRQNGEIGALNCMLREASGAAFGPGLQWFPSPLTELVNFFLVAQQTEGRLSALLPYHNPEVSGYVRKLYGGCLMLRKLVIETVGAFDERFFMYCEDVDLSRRISAAGWKLYYLSEAEVFHPGGSASAKIPGGFSVLMMCESFSKLMRKHHGWAGSAAYRVVAFFGAQFRLYVLLAQRLLAFLGLAGARPESAAAVRKYATVAKWALGLQRAVVPDQPARR